MVQPSRKNPTPVLASAPAPDRSTCTTRYQNDIQNAPYEQNAVAPKVFPFANSHSPAKTWTMPP